MWIGWLHLAAYLDEDIYMYVDQIVRPGYVLCVNEDKKCHDPADAVHCIWLHYSHCFPSICYCSTGSRTFR